MTNGPACSPLEATNRGAHRRTRVRLLAGLLRPRVIDRCLRRPLIFIQWSDVAVTTARRQLRRDDNVCSASEGSGSR